MPTKNVLSLHDPWWSNAVACLAAKESGRFVRGSMGGNILEADVWVDWDCLPSEDSGQYDQRVFGATRYNDAKGLIIIMRIDNGVSPCCIDERACAIITG